MKKGQGYQLQLYRYVKLRHEKKNMCTNNGYNFVCICTSLMRRLLQLLYLFDNSSRSRQNGKIRISQRGEGVGGGSATISLSKAFIKPNFRTCAETRTLAEPSERPQRVGLRLLLLCAVRRGQPLHLRMS